VIVFAKCLVTTGPQEQSAPLVDGINGLGREKKGDGHVCQDCRKCYCSHRCSAAIFNIFPFQDGMWDATTSMNYLLISLLQFFDGKWDTEVAAWELGNVTVQNTLN
jgi:hypothetical protein